MRFTWYIKDIGTAQSLGAGIGRELPIATLSRQLTDGITVPTMHQLLAEPGEAAG